MSQRKRRNKQAAVDKLFPVLQIVTEIVSTRAGKEAFPHLNRDLRKITSLAEVGKGAVELAHAVGGATRRFHVHYLAHNVRDLNAFSTASGFPLKYV